MKQQATQTRNHYAGKILLIIFLITVIFLLASFPIVSSQTLNIGESFNQQAEVHNLLHWGNFRALTDEKVDTSVPADHQLSYQIYLNDRYLFTMGGMSGCGIQKHRF